MLIVAVGYGDKDLQMPPKDKKLGDDAIAALTEWVKMGAPDPRSASAPKLPGLTDKARAHWASSHYQAGAARCKNKAWCATPVDPVHPLETGGHNMIPSPSANRETLIRRAYYDLTGLPPSPHEVDAFVNDRDPNAYNKIIDRLLASPQYGERWGRHWLDTARYADTRGDMGGRREGYRYLRVDVSRLRD